MAATAQLLHYSPLSNHHRHISEPPRISNPPASVSFPFSSSDYRSHTRSVLPIAKSPEKLELSFAGGNGSSGIGHGGSGGGGGDSGRWSSGDGDGAGKDESSSFGGLGPLGLFLNGWRSRVAADPQFPFKVLMEEIVGVSSCVLGDMASRPNFGLNELDFVFSTLVVGSILNFTLMYLLAPTLGASSSLPAIFTNCPKSHMFELGAYSLANRLGTF